MSIKSEDGDNLSEYQTHPFEMENSINVDNNNTNNNTIIGSNDNNNDDSKDKINVNDTNNTNTEKSDKDLSTDVAFDEDDLPIPKGIAVLDETSLEQNESLDLNLSNANNQVWLVKLTPQLAELWKDDSKLDGRTLGNIKIAKNVSKPKILLELNENLPDHKKLDKEYELKLVKQIVENEYVFSEAQFEQFRQRLMYRTKVVEMPNQPKLKSLNKEALSHSAKWTRKIKNYKREAQMRELGIKIGPDSGMGTTTLLDPNNNNYSRISKWKKFIPYAKTIPKKTEVIGKVVHECQIIPTKLATNNKLRMLEQKRKLNQMVKRKTINYIKNESAGILHGRATPNIQTGSTITLSKELASKREAAKQEGRAARMEREELMKVLFKLFNEYEYWTMKGLREKTNQPEAYLKECLENIAVMERKGPYALKWRLKDEYRKSIDVEKKVNQGLDIDDNKDEEKEESDEGDDDIEMEDVARL